MTTEPVNTAPSAERKVERAAENVARELVLAMNDIAGKNGWESKYAEYWESIPDNDRRLLTRSIMELLFNGTIEFN